MYSVEADSGKRVIVISAAGRVTEEELKGAVQEVREILKDAQPGFQLFTDFRWLQSMPASSARYIADIMDALAEKQIGSVIRVMPDTHKDIGLNILSRFHYDPKIPITTFDSLADALHSMAGEGETAS